MTQFVRDIMQTDLTAFSVDTTVPEAARAMRDRDIGDVLVTSDDQLVGIVTDRDLVVRAVAEHGDPTEVRLGQVCSANPQTLSPDDTVETAVARMKDGALRRLPVCDSGRPVGIVSLGDLAMERDPASALATISAAPPTT